MILIDASVFLAYDNVDDVHHLRAVLIMQNVEKGIYGNYFTSDHILQEVVGVTFRKKGKERALLLGNQIFKTMFLFNITDHTLKEGWGYFADTKYSLSLVDCTSIVLCKKSKVEYIATFDKEF